MANFTLKSTNAKQTAFDIKVGSVKVARADIRRPGRFSADRVLGAKPGKFFVIIWPPQGMKGLKEIIVTSNVSTKELAKREVLRLVRDFVPMTSNALSAMHG